MSGEIAHYRLNMAGKIETFPPAGDGECIAYLVASDGQDRLCVIEGGAFHNYKIGLLTVARLAVQATSRVCLVAPPEPAAGVAGAAGCFAKDRGEK